MHRAAAYVAAPPRRDVHVLHAMECGVKTELVVAGNYYFVFVRKLELSCHIGVLACSLGLTLLSQVLNSLTSETEPHLVKSPAWTKTSPSGMSCLRWEVRE